MAWWLRRYGLVLALLGAVAGVHAQTPPLGDPLLPNPLLTSDADGDKWPDGWPRVEGCTWEHEGDTAFLRLTPPKPGQMVLVYRRIDFGPAPPAALELHLKVRTTDLKSGEKEWNDATYFAHFKNRTGRVLQPEPPVAHWRGTTKGWVEYRVAFRVPKRAAYLELMPALFQATSGTFDLAACEVHAGTAALVPKPVNIASETVVPAAGGALPPELHVAGRDLLTPDGKPVWLQGLCVDSLEWSAGGERIDKSVPVAIEQWQANVVRLPVGGKFWFGRGPWQQAGEGGLAYRRIVDAAVAACAARGAYLVLDLHGFGMPVEEDLDFWRDAATRYKNHPAVLFELFNEPHDLSWELWRNGGELADPKAQHDDANPKENDQALTGEETVGMQALVNAVRSVGARNIVIAGTLDWSYDVSGVVHGFALTDQPGGNGIVYSSHLYPWKSDWEHKVLVAADKVPLFIGEVGAIPDYKGFAFIPENQRLPLEGWAEDVLAMMQAHRLNWTGFSFHPKCGPPAILDWDYTPTPFWGVYVKAALGGKTYDLKHLR